MTPTPKRILRTLSTVLGWILLLLLIGVPLSFLLFLALLSGLVPLYVLLPLLSVAAAGILALLLRRWCRPGPRGRCGIAAVFALVCLGAAVWMGWGIYCARLPTLDDRTLLLQDYQPFAPIPGRLFWRNLPHCNGTNSPPGTCGWTAPQRSTRSTPPLSRRSGRRESIPSMPGAATVPMPVSLPVPIPSTPTNA